MPGLQVLSSSSPPDRLSRSAVPSLRLAGGAAVASAVREYSTAGFDVWLSDGAATRIGLEPPSIAETITALDARLDLQQIRYVRYAPDRSLRREAPLWSAV
jgi:hypothetical protein